MFDLIPFDRETDGLFHDFNQMFQNSFSNDFDSLQSFRTDILDKGDKYVLRADLPGFQKTEISIKVEGSWLILSAEHKEEKNENKKNFICRERKFGAFSRSFDIDGIDSENISAAYKDGVLELELPKLVPTKAAKKRIEVK